MRPLSRRHSLFRQIAIWGHLKALPTNVYGEILMVPLESWRGWCSTYEPYMADAIRKYLSSDGAFVDIGAHYGIWSAYAAKQIGQKRKSFAYELSPYTILAKR